MNGKGGFFRFAMSSMLMAGLIIPEVLQAEEWEPVTQPLAIFEQGFIQVTGESEANQTRYQATRAAKVIAQRDLLEVMQKISVKAATTIKDGMIANETINSEVKGFLNGAVECGRKYNEQDGSAQVCLRIKLHGKDSVFDTIMPLMQKEGIIKADEKRFLPLTASAVPEEKVPAERSQEQAAPQNEDPAALQAAQASRKDGLILDIENKAFRPALANRIMTEKNEVVFDPSSVVPAILAERGCGGFTNKLEKARGLLASWGVEDPIIVKASDISQGTDAIILSDDAAIVSANDHQTSFLSQAKVVFVIH